jgi:hypothetical protein
MYFHFPPIPVSSSRDEDEKDLPVQTKTVCRTVETRYFKKNFLYVDHMICDKFHSVRDFPSRYLIHPKRGYFLNMTWHDHGDRNRIGSPSEMNYLESIDGSWRILITAVWYCRDVYIRSVMY